MVNPPFDTCPAVVDPNASMGCLLTKSVRFDRVAPPARSPAPTAHYTGTIAAATIESGASLAATSTVTPTAEASNPAPEQLNRSFIKALKAGDVAQVRSLLDQGVDIERRGMWENTPLLVACHYGHAAVALELLARGASPAAVNEKGCTALLHACVESMTEVWPATDSLPCSRGGNSHRPHPPPRALPSPAASSLGGPWSRS